jgi:cysteine desulfurase / selenocysteine lyase
MTREWTTMPNDAATSSSARTQPAPDWTAVRKQFPTTAKLTFLNSGMKMILPKGVAEAMQEWIGDVYDTAGETAFSMAEIEKTRAAVAEAFGAPASTISLIKNTTEGISIIAQGFPWRAGDNVVISDAEHENNTFPWRYLKSHDVEVRFAKPDAQGRVTLDCYRPLIDKRTRILALAWVAYGNGYRADVPELAAFCRERGVKLVVDGIQGVGVLATPISALGADAFIAGGHKAQLSLTGAGFMYTTPDFAAMITPPYAAKYSFTSNDRFQPELKLASDGHRFEYGNPNFLGCFVQRRSAEFVHSLGLDHIEARVRDLTTQLIEGAEQRQIRVRTPRPWQERAGLVSFDFDKPAGPAVAALKKQGIIVSEKDGFVRAGVHFYNDEADIERLLDGLTAL